MSGVKFRWNKDLEKEVGKITLRNMRRGVLFLEGETKRLVSRGNKDGKNPSLPGEPPKNVSGALMSSIGHEVGRDGADVVGRYGVRKGAASKYALRLELGFVGTDSKGRNISQLPRPFLRAALWNNAARVVRILTKA